MNKNLNCSKWIKITAVSILLLAAILLYLFIPRKITYSGTFRDLNGNEILGENDVTITFSYIPCIELFGDEFMRNMRADVVVKDLYGEIVWEQEFKNWYYFLPQGEDIPFARTSFFYYYDVLNMQESGQMFFDQKKQELLILTEYFEIEACTEGFRAEVEEVMKLK